MSQRHTLTDEQWDRIKDLVPGKELEYGKSLTDACIGWDDKSTVSIEAVEAFHYGPDDYLAGYELEPGLEVEWLIRQIQDEDGETLYWNNENGWGAVADATLFTSAERSCFDLPQGGEWA